MYILFGSYGKQFVKIDKIPNSNKFLSFSLSLSPSLLQTGMAVHCARKPGLRSKRFLGNWPRM